MFCVSISKCSISIFVTVNIWSVRMIEYDSDTRMKDVEACHCNSKMVIGKGSEKEYCGDITFET